MNSPQALSQIRIVLVRPSHPGNIGAAARAMKTMGLSRLYLVQPPSIAGPQARALATNAADVLESATFCETLDEALAGAVLAVAMSARTRELAHPPLEARAAAAEIAQSALEGEVAIVFGNEAAGLANADVMKCNRLSFIPADPECSSLNLAQAVQVMAYEVRMSLAVPQERVTPAPEYATSEDVEHFYAHLERSLAASGFLHPQYPRRLMDRMRRLFGRVRLQREEVSILRGMLACWDDKGDEKGDDKAGPRK